jgi:HPt (histidine-containing phosphotransfer) domain-containing protein
MTLRELYDNIGENYEQALRVLRVEKLVDKHIRKLIPNGLIDSLLAAGKDMDPSRLFETAHAVKGNCGNLGLTQLAAAASEITEEFRPGSGRKKTDAEVAALLEKISAQYKRTTEEIRKYEAGSL